MIVDHRTYELVVGGVPQWFKVYEAHGREPQMRILGNLIGYFVTEIGPLNQIVHMWGYDSFEERVERRARLWRDESWLTFVRETGSLVVRQECKLLTPTAFSPIR